MRLCWEAVLATLCVLILIGMVWWLLGRTLRPIPGKKARIFLAGRGDAEQLEQSIRGFMWLRGLGLLHCPIVIVDVDLNQQGYELALHLAGKWSGIAVWPLSHVPDDLKHLYDIE